MQENFTGRILIAMPHLSDVRFAQSIVYLCGHDENGAMGLILNRVLEEHSVFQVMEQLKLNPKSSLKDASVHFGGPVEMARGFVLHSGDYRQEGTMVISKEVSLSATLEILTAIAQDKGPKKSLCFLGYAGWGEGQLESEIYNNSWLMCEADIGLIFETPPEEQWHKALQKIGVDPELLSTDAGHA